MRLRQREQLVEAGRVVGVQRPRPLAAGAVRTVGLHQVGRAQVGRIEGQLAAQADGGLPDRLQEQPQPRVVHGAGVLGGLPGRAGGALRVGEAGPQPAYLRVMVGHRAGRPALLGRQHLAGLALPGLRLAQRPAERARLLA